MTQHSRPKDQLVEDTGYIASLTRTVVPERMTEAKNAIEDAWTAIDHQVLPEYRPCTYKQQLIHNIWQL